MTTRRALLVAVALAPLAAVAQAPGEASKSEWVPCCSGAWMRDTTPEFERFVRERYQQLTPAMRVRLCTEMFDAARRLVESSLPQGLDERERKRRVTERMYGREFADRVLPPAS